MVFHGKIIRYEKEKYRAIDRSYLLIKLSCAGDLMCLTRDYYIILNIIHDINDNISNK